MKDKNDIFNEIDMHIQNDDKPSEYIRELMDCPIFHQYPFSMISDLANVEQSKKHHPEGDVLTHTLMVTDQASKHKNESSDTRVLMWAALLHDIGKAPATKIRNGRITSYNHEKIGSLMVKDFFKDLTDERAFVDKVSLMVKWHMEALFVSKGLPFSDTKRMLEEVELSEIAILNLCDRLGRGDMTQQKIEEETENIDKFIKVCSKSTDKI